MKSKYPAIVPNNTGNKYDFPLPGGCRQIPEREFLKWQARSAFFRKKFSILGDSISTLSGYNPEGYELFYAAANCDETGVYEAKDTWWGKVIDVFGGELLVNDSWSGSRVTKLPNKMRIFPSACSDERTGNLHISQNNPDVF